MGPLSRKGKGAYESWKPHKRTQPFPKDCEKLNNESLRTPGNAMRVCPALLIAVLTVVIPLCASAQVGGGQRELPGGPWTWPPARPPARPPACQQLLTLRDESEKHSRATWAAKERKTSVKEACRLYKSILYTEIKFIRSLEDNGSTCGVPREWLKEAKERHAKASQIGRLVCEAAALDPSPIPWDALELGQVPTYDDNCRDCGKTGDFWWTIPTPGSR